MTYRNTTVRDEHRARIAHGKPPCALCGKPIDYDLRYPHPWSFTVDHRLPLALGGADTLDNKQPAHNRCNRAKSDQPVVPVLRRSTSLHHPPDLETIVAAYPRPKLRPAAYA